MLRFALVCCVVLVSSGAWASYVNSAHVVFAFCIDSKVKQCGHHNYPQSVGRASCWSRVHVYMSAGTFEEWNVANNISLTSARLHRYGSVSGIR